MAVISKPHTFSAGATIIASEHNDNFDTIINDYNGNITNANIAAGAGITDTKLNAITTASKVNGSALYGLGNINTASAGIIPAANIDSDGTRFQRLNATALSQGTVPTARLGSGTADSNSYLRGDSSWAIPAGKSVYTSSGTFSVPTGVSYIFVSLSGAGGGGGGGDDSQGGGGGGGAGAFCLKQFLSTTSGTTWTVSLGTGGAGGAEGNGGITGGVSFFSSGAIAIYCSGGSGGVGYATGANDGGPGGAGSIGTGGLVAGAAGGAISYYTFSGGSGGEGGNANDRGGGGGGSNPLGVGCPGAAHNADVGTAGYGGGGGGGAEDGATSRAGGKGGNGICIVEW